VASVCQQEGRILVTLDLDFADIRTYPPADYSGIIVLRLSRLGKARVLSAVSRMLPTLEQEPLAGRLWIVDENTVRIRS
jgi:predicted nuclease of predicted toxin-antitoxin system